MSHRLTLLAAAAAVAWSLIAAAPALAQPKNMRGTVTAFEGGTLSVKTARGTTQSFKVGADSGLFLVTKADMGAIQSGRFVGVTSVEQGGKRIAREVHVFAESLRGLAEGHYPWDLEGEPNMMTNANIAKIEEVGSDRVLKLNYSGGEETIAVPANAAIVAFDKTGADQLVAGRQVFIIPAKDDAGAAAAVVVGAEGVRPPM